MLYDINDDSMDRRTTIKGIFTFGFLTISSFSVYKWMNFHRVVNSQSISSYKDLIAELAETIIPLTDTPGAKAAKVENYIINVLLNCTDKVGQNIFLTGLRDVEEYTMGTFNKSFLKCNLNERNQTLKYFEDKSIYPYKTLNKISNKFFGEPFFQD